MIFHVKLYQRLTAGTEARLLDDGASEEVLELGFGNGHTFPLAPTVTPGHHSKNNTWGN